MNSTSQQTNSRVSHPNQKDVLFSGHQFGGQTCDDVLFDSTDLSETYPAPVIEETFSLLSGSSSNDMDIDLDNLFGLTTESAGQRDSTRSNSVASSSTLSVEHYDQIFPRLSQSTESMAGIESSAVPSHPSTPKPREPVFHRHIGGGLMPARPVMNPTMAPISSTAPQNSLTCSAVQRGGVDYTFPRMHNITNTSVGASRASVPSQVPVSHSLRTHVGTSLPNMSSSSRESYCRSASMQASIATASRWSDPTLAFQAPIQLPTVRVQQSCPAPDHPTDPRIYRAEVSSCARGAPILGPLQTPTWASWVEDEQELLRSISSPALPAATSRAYVQERTGMSGNSFESSARQMHVRRVADASKSGSTARCAPTPLPFRPRSAAVSSSADSRRPPSNQPSAQASRSHHVGVALAESRKRRHDEIDRAPTIVVVDTTRAPTRKKTCRSDLPCVPRAEGERPRPPHREHPPRSTQATSFVCDRLGDIGLCKFTVKDEDGVFRRVCNAKIPDSADAARDHLYWHFREHGLYELGIATKVWCPWCKTKKTQFNGFSRHLVDVHLKINMTRCPCGGSNSRGQQNHNVKRHLECDSHLLWVAKKEQELEEMLGLCEVDVGRDEDFIQYEQQWSDEPVEGSIPGTRRRRRYSV